MFYKIVKFCLYLILIFYLTINISFSEKINSINVSGNERIPDETIIMFANIPEDLDVEINDINLILKNIYESNFFKNVKVNLSNNILYIKVEELPIIENISIKGIKANRIKDAVFTNLVLKQRSSYNENFLKKDLKLIESNLQELGYFFSNVEVILTDLNNNKVNLEYNVTLGEKAKIKKIKFIGNKIFKDKKLKNIITSEEYKFWKFISQKKYLNKNLTKFDERLLKNFYLNQGYYDVNISSTFGKLIDENSFELIFNIDAKERFLFNNLELKLPDDFQTDNFNKIDLLFKDIKGKPYSINKIEKILEEIDKITLNEEFENISAEVEETIENFKINLIFNIQKTDKITVEKINIFGNNITRESVIRNQFEIDEGDSFNEILAKKTINNIKNLGFFKNVTSEIIQGENNKSKIINISVEEKATGEIMAGAGFGTNGGSVMFSVKENNYLGKGIKLSNTLLINEESIKGSFSISNPNYKNSDKSVYLNLQALETDRLKNFGYKTNKTGFSFGTGFEIYDDTFINLGNSHFYEKITTNSTASDRQKKQEGNYWDSFLNLNLDYDKRNQKFQTSEGYRSRYFLDLPFISDTYSLSNTYTYKYFTQLYENNRSNFSIYLKSVDSITGEDVKLSERVFLPSNRLRGFESGKVGPKDGSDFIGGNYATSLNFSSTLPYLFENSQNIDFLFFVDAANIWGVDYDSSLNDGGKIRSAFGIGIDWLTPVGPLNFTFAETITKADTDITENFRFNLGTTF